MVKTEANFSNPLAPNLKGTTGGRPSQSGEISIDTAPYETILVKYFSNGYRLGLDLDMKRMRKYYEEVNGKALELDQADLVQHYNVGKSG